jgi:hypothetical protein
MAIAKVALLVETEDLSPLTEEVLHLAGLSSAIEICALVYLAPQPKRPKTMILGWYEAMSEAASSILYGLEAKLLKAFTGHFERERRRSSPVRHPEDSRATPRTLRYPQDAAKIRACGTDILINCTTAQVPEIASVCGVDVLAAESDGVSTAAGSTGFWETLGSKPFTALSIIHHLASGEKRVVAHGTVITRSIFRLNNKALVERAALRLIQIASALASGAELPQINSNDEQVAARAIKGAPHFHDLIRYGISSALAIARRASLAAMGSEIHWNVKYCFQDWRTLGRDRIYGIENPPGSYLADPFAFQREEKTYIFAEEYDLLRKQGYISVYSVEPDGSSQRLGVALEENFHLSFPFVFEFNEALYMIPESCEARQVRIYKSINFPLDWELCSIALDGIEAVDTIAFPRGGRWWMLTTVKPTASSLYSETWAFTAESPLGTWAAVPTNPVVSDASKGRNGGLIRDRDEVFRVAQRPAFDLYGEKAAVFKINHISYLQYEEEKVLEFDPTVIPGARGIHHMHSINGITVFDVAQRRFTRNGSICRPAKFLTGWGLFRSPA